uniref:P-type domain-containing protein n=1 Tax=Globisporangium ultimum (strain ATCC 200006 / CBS 805.95 / DAOM BR144) TaxID=431595 RepID=K3WK60_GLOUD
MKTALACWASLALLAACGTAEASKGRPGECHPKALVDAGKARFCVLTSRVLRMEWSAGSVFRDDPTMAIQTRWFDAVPDYVVTKDGGKIVLTTKHLRLTYDTLSKESFSDANLKVELLDKQDALWKPSMTDQIRQDALPGTIRTLDGVNGPAHLDCLKQGADYTRDSHCTYGLISKKNGFTVVDDSLAATFDQDPSWPWLNKPVTQADPVDDTACAAITNEERRVCGLETATQEQCMAQGCCYTPTSLYNVTPSDDWLNDGFRCYYSATSYQDLYFLGHGHDFKGALREFTQISGKIPVPPRFAFGVFYSRWWAYSDADLQHDIVEQYEQRGLPLDVVVIDMDWHLTFYGDNNPDQAGQRKGWTGLTWDKQLFPDAKQFIAWLHEKGIAVTLNMHPASGVQPWEDSYERVARAMGIDPTTQKYVPFRITDKKFAETWFNYSVGAREADGVDFWWLDWQQGEDWIQVKEGRSDINPTLWLNYVFFTNPSHWGRTSARPVLLHRFGGLGNHRFPVGFSGDVFVSWDSLRFQPYFTTMAANVGFGYWSHDLGGFQNPTEPELFMRWLQWGAFAPIFRTHSSKDSKSDRRIWKYNDEYYEVARAAMEMRTALIPYVYSEAKVTHETGLSVLHGAFFEWPEHDEAYTFTEQYLYGSQLLVSPVVHPVDVQTKLSNKSIWVPPGTWYDFTTGNVINGPIVYSCSYALNEIPRFAKAGAIIPMADHDSSTESSVGQNTHLPKKLHLVVAPGASKGHYELLEDDGLTKEYLSGHNSSTLFDFVLQCPSSETVFDPFRANLLTSPTSYASCSGGQVDFNIFPVKGSFPASPKTRSYKIEFLGVLPAASVSVNGNALKPIRFPDLATEVHVNGFTYAAETLSLVVYLSTPLGVDADVQTKVTVQFIKTPSPFDASVLLSGGFVGKFARLHAVKVLLDNQWGQDTVLMRDYADLLLAAETDRRLSYKPESIATELFGFAALFDRAVNEVKALGNLQADVKAQALAFLTTSSYTTNHVKYEP